MVPRPYKDFNSYMRDLFGCRVQKISLDAGLTCPNRDGTLGYGGCIYCNERGSGTGAARQSRSITEQITTAKAFLRKRYNATKFLAYFQSFSNTYAPLDVLRSLFEQALSDPEVVGLSIGTRPDCVSEDVLDYVEGISRHRLVWVEYGLQSSNNMTLRRISRGHDVRAFEDAVRRTRARKIPVCTHVILGLPDETPDDMLKTARFVGSQDIQAVKIHLLYVVKGTILEQWYLRGDYQCLTREQYVHLASEFLTLLPPHIIIQRLTGDPHPDELVAPLWALQKQQNLNAILNYMHTKDLYQGKAYSGAP
jgi:radical SAM protein (TIGR01212 family)